MLTCSPILAQACPLLRPKLGLFWCENPWKIKFLQMLWYDISLYAYFGTDFKNWKNMFKIAFSGLFLPFFIETDWKFRKIKFPQMLWYEVLKFKRFKRFENSKKFEKCMFKEFNKFNSLHVRIVFFCFFLVFCFSCVFFVFCFGVLRLRLAVLNFRLS